MMVSEQATPLMWGHGNFRGSRLSGNNRVKAFREARGLSLDGLAGLADTTNQQISHLETGKRRLTVEWLQRLGSALGCHPWELVSDDLPQNLGREELHLLEAFQRMSAEQRKALLQLVDAISPMKAIDRPMRVGSVG